MTSGSAGNQPWPPRMASYKKHWRTASGNENLVWPCCSVSPKTFPCEKRGRNGFIICCQCPSYPLSSHNPQTLCASTLELLRSGVTSVSDPDLIWYLDTDPIGNPDLDSGKEQWPTKWKNFMLWSSVPDPDSDPDANPEVFGHPGAGSVSQRYGFEVLL